jgi:Trk K+ transport system NAD-binding subunit
VAVISVPFMVLRRLRAPILVVVLSYAISVLGMTLIDGVDAQGNPAPPMSFFHALYFVSYTATTIGFGELPTAFSEAQRMWAVVVVHLTVVAWTFSILTALALFEDSTFRRAVAQIRLAGRVRRMREPFHLICGCGDTGQRLAKTMDRLDMRFVMVERDLHRLQKLELQDLRGDPPILNADAAEPPTLLMAGLRHPMCRGVLAISRDDATNLAVATSARLLNRAVPVIAAAQTANAAASMRAFGTHHVISPFDTFAEHLILAMQAPGCYRLLSWLTAPFDAKLEKEHEPPRGRWLVCGHGRFGRAVADRLLVQGLEVIVVDPLCTDDPEPLAGQPMQLCGVGTETGTLERAGVRAAVGLVAAADNDVTNFAIAAFAQKMNPKLFVVLRQNQAVNQVLFDNFRVNLVMKPSEIIADECVALLTTPLLDRFLAIVRRKDDAWADEVIHQLRKRVGTRSPRAWTIRIDGNEAPAICEWLQDDGQAIALGDLMRDPGSRGQELKARALMILRDGHEIPMPGDDIGLLVNDRILFAGRGLARRRLQYTLFDANVLRYVLTGRDTPGGWVFRRRMASKPSARSAIRSEGSSSPT